MKGGDRNGRKVCCSLGLTHEVIVRDVNEPKLIRQNDKE